MEQRLIKARLEHIRNDENAIRVFFELLRYLGIREAVQPCRCQRRFLPLILVLAGKGDDRLIWTAPVRKAFIDGVIIFDTARNAGGHDHSASLPADFSFGNDLFVEVVYHHSRFLGYGIAVAFYKAAQLLLRQLLIEHRVILDGLHQLIEAVDRRVVLQHIQNESFLDCLFHRINMERSMLNIVAVLIRNAEGFQRFILRGCGKRKVAGIVQQFAPFHHGVDLILVIHLVVRSKP